MAKPSQDGQSGGVSITGHVGSVGRDIAGRDVITNTTTSTIGLDAALAPVAAAVASASPERQLQAEETLEQLKAEVAKGEKADDGIVGRLVSGLVNLVPAATAAVVGAFATPILGGIAGPVTKFALEQLRGK